MRRIAGGPLPVDGGIAVGRHAGVGAQHVGRRVERIVVVVGQVVRRDGAELVYGLHDQGVGRAVVEPVPLDLGARHGEGLGAGAVEVVGGGVGEDRRHAVGLHHEVVRDARIQVGHAGVFDDRGIADVVDAIILGSGDGVVGDLHAAIVDG